MPGHGAVVDRDFVDEQRSLLERLADRFREAMDGGPTGLEPLVSAGRGLGLEDVTLREAAVRALELRAS